MKTNYALTLIDKKRNTKKHIGFNSMFEVIRNLNGVISTSKIMNGLRNNDGLFKFNNPSNTKEIQITVIGD